MLVKYSGLLYPNSRVRRIGLALFKLDSLILYTIKLNILFQYSY